MTKFCECGCGKEIKEYRRFVRGHNWRGKLLSLGTRKRISESMKGRKRSEETKKRISEELKGRKRSLESRKKQSETLTGRKQSEETIRKRVEKIRGRKQSEEHIRKRVEKRRGRKQSEEHIRKRVEKRRGKKHSLKTRKRMSESQKERYENDENHPWRKKENIRKRVESRKEGKGYKHSLETRKRISESRKGIIFTEEHRKNMSIAANNAINPRYNSGYFYSKKMQKEIFYQSGLELRALEMFEKDASIWSIERYNLGSIKYKMNGNYHSYSPDYILNKKIVYEVKPKWMLKDEIVLAKIRAGKRYCKEKGLEFRVLTERDLKEKEQSKK